MAKQLTDKKQTPRMGRPTVEQSRQLDDQVKAVALGLFLDKGFDAVTMEAVAAAAGITKRSLYARYKDKSELFSAAMRSSKNEWNAADADQRLMAGATLHDKLQAAAELLMSHTLDARIIKLSRTAAAQAIQFPDDIQQTYNISLSPRIQSVVMILEAHQSELDIRYSADLAMTAELFLGLIIGIPSKLAGYGTLRAPEFEQRRVHLAVDLFNEGICRKG